MKLNELIQPKSTKAVFTFGRFNPPTKGHAHLLNMVKNGANGADHYVYTGRTQDPKRNPLNYEDKVTLMRAMYPTVNIVDDPNVKNPWQALEELGKHYSEITLVVGSDRKQDFETQMKPYMKDFGIEKFTVVSSGERDADATDVQGVSATKARAFARAGDFNSFAQTVDGGENLKKQLYTKVRQGMGVNESKKPKMPKDPEIKKRDPNWRDMEALRKSGAAGTHKDKKALDKRGYEKHKGKSYDINESIKEEPKSKPIVYVDMDGVLANFFEEYANLAGVKSGNYKDIPPAKTDPTLNKMIGTDFFNRLPKFPTADKLLQLVTSMFGSYSILSAPLRGDHKNSEEQKRKWIQRELAIKPDNIIIVGRKDSYAVQSDGTPNILIDDRGRNIQGWRDRGGFGVKYQADEDPLSKVEQALTEFKGQYNLTEWGGRVVKGINTTPDVGVNQIPIEAKKMGFKVTKDGVPPIMQPKNMRRVKRMKEALIKMNGSNKELTLQQQIDLIEITKGIRKVIQERKVKKIKKDTVNPTEVPYQNDPGTMSLLTHPGTAMNQKMRATAKPGTDEWFKTWRTLSYLTKGRKNHYMLPIKEQLEKLLIKHGIIKEAPGDALDKKNLLGLRQDVLSKLESLPQTKEARRTLEKVRELLQATDATDNLKAYADRIADLGTNDSDVANAVEQLTKLIGAVVQMSSVKDRELFLKKWEADQIVKVDKLMKGGEVMKLSQLFNYYGKSKAVTYVVNSLAKDAGYGLGKGEFLLAVLSRRIQKAPGKGDLLIDGKSIEVKATDGGSPRFSDQEVRVAQGYEQTRDTLFDLYKEEIAQTGGAGSTGLNLARWVQVGQATTVDKPTFAKNTTALLDKIFPNMNNSELANAIAAGQLGKAKSLYANSCFTRYMTIKQDEAVLYINLAKKDPTYVMFRSVEDLASMGLYLHADTIYILGMSGQRDVYPQMSVKVKQ